MPKIVKYDADYIRSNVTITEAGCWEWNLYRDKDGYGQANSSKPGLSRAHRLSYSIFKGEIKNAVVRHTCDNPPCCNPDHLIEGSHRDNQQDAIDRGLVDMKVLSEIGNSYLRTPPEVEEAILNHYRTKGGTQEGIGKIFGVSRSTVRNIIIKHT